jgi:multisubunit Na+/H+ antiporter MnhF subunit
MSPSLNAAAPHHLPVFITAPGETDVFMVVMAVFLVLAVLAVGLLFLRLHTLPERMAHRSHKLQFEIVAVLGLLALFTHQHIFWVAGLLLALIDIPDFGNPLRRMAGSLETIAGLRPGEGAAHEPDEIGDHSRPVERASEGADEATDAGATEVPKTITPARTPARPKPQLSPINTRS